MKRGIISSLGFLVVMQKKGNSTLRTSYLLLREIVSFFNKRNTTVFSVLPLYNSIIAKNIYSQKGFQKINACQPFFHSPCLIIFCNIGDYIQHNTVLFLSSTTLDFTPLFGKNPILLEKISCMSTICLIACHFKNFKYVCFFLKTNILFPNKDTFSSIQ